MNQRDLHNLSIVVQAWSFLGCVKASSVSCEGNGVSDEFSAAFVKHVF